MEALYILYKARYINMNRGGGQQPRVRSYWFKYMYPNGLVTTSNLHDIYQELRKKGINPCTYWTKEVVSLEQFQETQDLIETFLKRNGETKKRYSADTVLSIFCQNKNL